MAKRRFFAPPSPTKSAKPGQDFFPLTVNYQEKTFAAGKIPGGFFKREGRPSEKETLVSRLIDRPIRPLFVPGFLNETQVICTVLSHDLENDPDIVAMIGASAALTLVRHPVHGPDRRLPRRLYQRRIRAEPDPRPDAALAARPYRRRHQRGRADGRIGGQGAVRGCHARRGHVRAQELPAGHRGDHRTGRDLRPRSRGALPEPPANKGEIEARLREAVGPQIEAAYRERGKQERSDRLDAAKRSVAGLFENDDERALALKLFKDIEKEIVRGAILRDGTRIDGRDTKTVRPIDCQVGILPRAHGSVLFTRGETQALVVATLGTGQDEQIIDALEGEYRENFMLHYNFPPYSTGEAGRMGSPGRREIGHGKLAWRAVRPLLPPKDGFPYTIRVVSEITESNGSSSMASVCGASLALMDAGVPLPRPVAGIAMGLIKERDGFAVLSDILGDEDHLGDMDFKVAGTERGITALQMDIKITSITEEIMRVALDQARDGRAPHPRRDGEGADRRARGGQRERAADHDDLDPARQDPRGHRLRRQGHSRDHRDDRRQGRYRRRRHDQGLRGRRQGGHRRRSTGSAASSPSRSSASIYTGKVVKVVDFGAFVNFLGSRDGLVHISELAQQRVGKVSDVVKVGDQVKVKVLGFDDRGKVKLSMRQVDQQTGEDLGSARRQSEPARNRRRCNRRPKARRSPGKAGTRASQLRGGMVRLRTDQVRRLRPRNCRLW